MLWRRSSCPCSIHLSSPCSLQILPCHAEPCHRPVDTQHLAQSKSDSNGRSSISAVKLSRGVLSLQQRSSHAATIASGDQGRSRNRSTDAASSPAVDAANTRSLRHADSDRHRQTSPQRSERSVADLLHLPRLHLLEELPGTAARRVSRCCFSVVDSFMLASTDCIVRFLLTERSANCTASSPSFQEVAARRQRGPSKQSSCSCRLPRGSTSSTRPSRLVLSVAWATLFDRRLPSLPGESHWLMAASWSSTRTDVLVLRAHP